MSSWAVASETNCLCPQNDFFWHPQWRRRKWLQREKTEVFHLMSWYYNPKTPVCINKLLARSKHSRKYWKLINFVSLHLSGFAKILEVSHWTWGEDLEPKVWEPLNYNLLKGHSQHTLWIRLVCKEKIRSELFLYLTGLIFNFLRLQNLQNLPLLLMMIQQNMGNPTEIQGGCNYTSKPVGVPILGCHKKEGG
jgi:hypothetical protein